MSFKALSKSASKSLGAPPPSLSELIRSLTFLRNRVLPNDSIASQVPSLTICLLVDDTFKNPEIWTKHIEDACEHKVGLHLLVLSMDSSCNSRIPAQFKADLDVSATADVYSSATGYSVGYRRLLASLALLDTAFRKFPMTSHFAMLTGNAIPIISGRELVLELKHNESWMSLPSRSYVNREGVCWKHNENGIVGVNTAHFDPASLCRVDRFGHLLCNHHASLLLKVNGEIGAKFSAFWANMTCFSKNDAINTYYSSLLNVLGYSHLPRLGEKSCIVSRRVNYPHFIGYENEANIENIVFPIENLSQDMIREFRSNGSLFAVDFEDNISSSSSSSSGGGGSGGGDIKRIGEPVLRNWSNLVLLKRSEYVNMAFSNREVAFDGSNDFYSNKQAIIRYSGSPIDFDSRLSAYLNSNVSSNLNSQVALKLSDSNHNSDSNCSAAELMNLSYADSSDNSILDLGKRPRENVDYSSRSSEDILETNKVRLIDNENGHNSIVGANVNMDDGNDEDSLLQYYANTLKIHAVPSAYTARSRVFRNVKIVINSHVKYKMPVSVLLQSIIESDLGFEASLGGVCFSWDVIVSLAGCDEDVPPMRVLVTEVADVTMGAHSNDEAQVVPFVTVVRQKLNSFDWTAKAALFKYKDDPLICSDYYFYILDTSKVDKNFKAVSSQIIPSVEVSEIRVSDESSISSSSSSSSSSSNSSKSRWVVKSSDKYREKLFMTPKPHSSISIFGRGVVRNFGHNFDKAISKIDGLILELYEKPLFHPEGFVQHGITRFGDVNRLQYRLKLPGNCDWYPDPSRSATRDLFHYTEFGLLKAVSIFIDEKHYYNIMK